MKTWDAFISHASEDRDLVHSLADSLHRAGMRIWVDRRELRLGDSLSEKIDAGLADSRFGIVVLSPSFMAKRWPRQELNGLMAREDCGHNVILPVWHEIDKQTLAAYSPMLADRLAVSTENGVASVVASIIEAIIDPKSGGPAVEAPTLTRRLIAILEQPSSASMVRDFLVAHPEIVGHALGSYGRRQGVRGAARLGSFELDLCVRLETGATTRTFTWMLVQLEEPSEPLLGAGISPSAAVERRVHELEAFRWWAEDNLDQIQVGLPGFATTFKAIVVGGRRAQLGGAALEVLRRYNGEHTGITLRTYDWLVDAATALR